MKGIPTPRGERPAQTQGEHAFVNALGLAEARRKQVAATAAALRDARNALSSSVAHHGPAAPETKQAREEWKKARWQMLQASQACERAEQDLDTAIHAWAAEAAQHSQPRQVVRPFHSEAPQVPAEGGPPWRSRSK